MVLLSSGGQFLTGKTVKDGDIVTFLDEGQWVQNTKFLKEDGTPTNQFIIGVQLRGEKRQVKVTGFSRESLGEAWGYDTKEWIGKQAYISLIPAQGGKLSIWLKPIKTDTNIDDIEFKN